MFRCANYIFSCKYVGTSSVASPKFWERPNILTLSERHYFVWDTTFQSTKRQDMLGRLGLHGPLSLPGYA